MIAVNQYGRQWDELDALKAQAHLRGAFTLLSADGLPLCGRHIDGELSATYIAGDWHAQDQPE